MYRTWTESPQPSQVRRSLALMNSSSVSGRPPDSERSLIAITSLDGGQELVDFVFWNIRDNVSLAGFYTDDDEFVSGPCVRFKFCISPVRGVAPRDMVRPVLVVSGPLNRADEVADVRGGVLVSVWSRSCPRFIHRHHRRSRPACCRSRPRSPRASSVPRRRRGTRRRRRSPRGPRRRRRGRGSRRSAPSARRGPGL